MEVTVYVLSLGGVPVCMASRWERLSMEMSYYPASDQARMTITPTPSVR